MKNQTKLPTLKTIEKELDERFPEYYGGILGRGESLKCFIRRQIEKILAGLEMEEKLILKEKPPVNDEDWDIHCGKIWGFNEAVRKLNAKIKEIRDNQKEEK